MLPDLSRDCINTVVLLCKNSISSAYQILIDISALKILRLIRAKKMKTSMLQVRIDSAILLSDGLKLYKDPNLDITRPIEVTYKGKINGLASYYTMSLLSYRPNGLGLWWC